MLSLTLQIGTREPQIFRFSSETTISIGRAPGNDLPVPDSRISALHGEISRSGVKYNYRDNQSTNGSLVLRGQERILVDGKSSAWEALNNGDILLLGDVDNPVVLQVSIEAVFTDNLEGTIVAQRTMETAAELSHVLVSSNQESATLLALLNRVGGQSDIQWVFGEIAQYLLNHVQNAARVVLAGSDDSSWVLSRGETKAEQVDDNPPPYPRVLVQRAKDTGEAMLCSDLDSGSGDTSMVRLTAQTAIAVPLGGLRGTHGALVLLGEGPAFSAKELELTVALAFQVSGCFESLRTIQKLRAVERRLRDENRYLREHSPSDSTFSDIIGESDAIRRVFEYLKVVMNTEATVLVTGETGTGKELIARALHSNSGRASRLFAAVNCAALSENLLESELFGHVKGAFTGAHENKKGLFQVADKGSLFLDEIGELSGSLQAKLLRVLQEGEVTPVGSSRPLKVDVRIIAATHRDLRAEVKEGTFREDLFYRINVFPIHVPALRDRPTDIPLLAQCFLDRYSKKFGKSVAGISERAIAALKSYSFPGNIRELENEIQRALLLAGTGENICVRELSDHVSGGSPLSSQPVAAPSGKLKETMAQLERQVLLAALEGNGWNRSETARQLGISRQALMVKLSKYELAPD